MSKTWLKYPDWPEILERFVEAERHQPFTWGGRDCCQTVRRCIWAMTGRDPAAGMKLGRYKTAKGAQHALARLGGIDALPGKAGFPEIRVTMAQRGDVMLCEMDGRDCLALCLGGMAAGPGFDGLVFVPTLQCKRAWRVG